MVRWGSRETKFLSTPSARRATVADLRKASERFAFLSTPSARRATCAIVHTDTRDAFLSTPSARRATTPWQAMPPAAPYFYPRPPRGGRLSASRSISSSSLYFYPRPPRGGRLAVPSTFAILAHNFYPRPPRGGRRICSRLRRSRTKFLSTPSARRATTASSVHPEVPMHFYPRPPRGGRPWPLPRLRSLPSHFYPRPPRGGRPPLAYRAEPDPAISIHALREEGDYLVWFRHPQYTTFLSTPSARRATPHGAVCSKPLRISIHALREEGDTGAIDGHVYSSISIHALREEGDPGHHSFCSGTCYYFYPRPPRGGRQRL